LTQCRVPGAPCLAGAPRLAAFARRGSNIHFVIPSGARNLGVTQRACAEGFAYKPSFALCGAVHGRIATQVLEGFHSMPLPLLKHCSIEPVASDLITPLSSEQNARTPV